MDATPAWPYPVVRLRPGKENLLSKRHPWIFSGALAELPESPLVRVADASGSVFAVATASPGQTLAARIFAFEDRPLDASFFRGRFEGALALRQTLGLDGPEAGCRWVFGEADGLPGLVVDRYGPALVLQVGSAGLEALREVWWPELERLGRSRGWRHSSSAARRGGRRRGFRS